MRPAGSAARGRNRAEEVRWRDPPATPLLMSSSNRHSALSRGAAAPLLETCKAGSLPGDTWTWGSPEDVWVSASASAVSRSHVSSAETIPGSDEIFIASLSEGISAEDKRCRDLQETGENPILLNPWPRSNAATRLKSPRRNASV